MLRFTVLGSGSAGNCAVLRTGDGCVLIDAGLSASQITTRIQAAGIDPEALSAVLLTHEHGDHTRGLDVFTRKHQLPVYCTAMTRQVLKESVRGERNWRIIPDGGSFEIGALKVETFAVPHDAVEPVGFVFRHAGVSMGMVSDVGHVTTLMRARLRDLDALFLEANYCPDLLAADTKRPWATRQRIAGRHGHLSNLQAAKLAGEIANSRLQHIVLGHLSQDCNRPEVALSVVRAALERCRYGHVSVRCAMQDGLREWVEIAAPAPMSQMPQVSQVSQSDDTRQTIAAFAGAAQTVPVRHADASSAAAQRSSNAAAAAWSQMDLFS